MKVWNHWMEEIISKFHFPFWFHLYFQSTWLFPCDIGAKTRWLCYEDRWFALMWGIIRHFYIEGLKMPIMPTWHRQQRHEWYSGRIQNMHPRISEHTQWHHPPPAAVELLSSFSRGRSRSRGLCLPIKASHRDSFRFGAKEIMWPYRPITAIF